MLRRVVRCGGETFQNVHRAVGHVLVDVRHKFLFLLFLERRVVLERAAACCEGQSVREPCALVY